MPKGTGGESWLKQFRRLKQPLGLPRLDAGEYLLEAMFRLGPTCSNGLADVTPWDDDGDGNVESPRVTSSDLPRAFERAALQAVGRWKFEATGASHASSSTVQFDPPGQ